MNSWIHEWCFSWRNSSCPLSYKDAEVLLPVAIQLEDWIEHRIGAEAPPQNSDPFPKQYRNGVLMIKTKGFSFVTSILAHLKGFLSFDCMWFRWSHQQNESTRGCGGIGFLWSACLPPHGFRAVGWWETGATWVLDAWKGRDGWGMDQLSLEV